MDSIATTEATVADIAPTVVVVEDDRQARHALAWLLRSADYQVQEFAEPQEALDTCDPEMPGCLILDLQLPGMDGLELRRRLVENGCQQPFIVVSGFGRVSTVVQAMHMGAVDFIEKPLKRQRLFECVHRAIQCDARNRHARSDRQRLQELLDSLTLRERQVLRLVAVGKLTKEIAGQLGISTKTVDVYRSKVTKKMQVSSVNQLIYVLARHSLLEDRPKAG